MTTVDPATLAAVAEQFGITVEEAAARLGAPQGPLFEVLIAKPLAKANKNTRRTFKTHVHRLRDGVGPVCDQECEPCLLPPDFTCRCDCAPCLQSRVKIEALAGTHVSPATFNRDTFGDLATVAGRIAVKRGIVENRVRHSRGLAQKNADGIGATETAISAARWLCKIAAPHIDGYDAHDIDKPHRPGNQRRPLRDFELVELAHETAAGGDDPELDVLLFDYAIATGSRRLGAYSLTCGQLHDDVQLIGMKDKYGRIQAAPVSAELIARLRRHAIGRGGDACDPGSVYYRPDSPLFHYRARGGGYRPITSRRFDTLHGRWQRALPWANEEQVALHHLRHSMAAIIKTRFGPQYAKRYLRHADGDVTELYGACTLEELARAMADLLDFEHPLVHGIEERRAETLRRLGVDGDTPA